jgi:hypothetical protein
VWLVPLLLFVVTRVVAWLALPYASEDAYITFRYARHLAIGQGLTYNPGSAVFGFSSPIWTVWCSLGFALIRNPVVWTRATALLADLVTLLVVGRMLQRQHSGSDEGAQVPAAAFTFFFATWPYFAIVSVSGMENSTMLALIALGAALARRGSLVSGPLLGALALWRPEGLAAAAVLALGARNRDRLVALAILAAGVTALTWYFGSPIPQSVLAKSSLYGTPGPWAGRYWWDWMLPVLLGGVPVSGEGRLLYLLAVIWAPALAAGSVVLWRQRSAPLALLVGACVSVWLGYSLLGVAYFYWYLVVPLGGITALAALGLPRIVRGRWIYAATALYVVSSWSVAYPIYVGRAQNEFYAFGRTAEFLFAHARPGQKVMLEPIGMIGYRCPVVVVDEVGLVSPEVARRRMQGPGWYTDVADAERPEWIVVRRDVLESGTGFAGRGAPFRSVAERDTLLARYQVATVIREPERDLEMLVLRRSRP